jgi:dihydropteroate synthase
MGIVNVTPDSFSDGGRYSHIADAVEQALRLEDDGADAIDIGGESTRPGAAPVSLDEELRRTLPVIEQLQGRLGTPISIDTTKAAVAQAALAAGAAIVNDISGLRFDPAMIDVCRDARAGVIVMHMQGTPQTMQHDPHYEDVVREVRDFFAERLTTLTAAGLHPERLVFDPGIGFGKTAEHNLELLSHIGDLRVHDRPLLIGHSRKRFLQRLLGRAVDERVQGTVGVALAVAAQGADLIRVHDVAACRDAWLAFDTVRQWPARQMLPPTGDRGV